MQKFPKNKRAIDGFKATSVRPISKSKTAHEPTQDQQQALISLYNQGQFQQTLDKVKPLLQKFPNSVTLYNIQGVANKGLGQFDAAIVSYEKALSISPNYADAHFNTANIFREIGELEKAVAAYKKALTIAPDNAAIHNNMGATFKQLGDLRGH